MKRICINCKELFESKHSRRQYCYKPECKPAVLKMRIEQVKLKRKYKHERKPSQPKGYRESEDKVFKNGRKTIVFKPVNLK